MARRKKTENTRDTSRRGISWIWMIIGLLVLSALGYFTYKTLVRTSDLQESTAISDPPIALEGEAALDRITELNRDELLPLDERWERPLLEGDYNDARRQLESLLSNTLEMSEFTRHAYFLGLLYLYMPEPHRNVDRAIQYLEIGKSFRSDAVLYIIKAYVENGQLEKAEEILQSNPGLKEKLPEGMIRKIQQ